MHYARIFEELEIYVYRISIAILTFFVFEVNDEKTSLILIDYKNCSNVHVFS